MATITTDATTAREKLHHIIDEIPDARVINLYEFLKEESVEEDFEFPEELKAELDQIEEDYQNGVKFYTKEEVDAHTHELLQSLREKNV